MAMRPKSVTALSVLGIIWASLGTIGTIFNVYTLGTGPKTPADAAVMADTATAIHQYGYVGFIIIGTMLLWVGSIASLSLKPAGRHCMLAYAWIAGPAALIFGLINLVYIMPMVAVPALENYARSIGGEIKPGFLGGLYCGSVLRMLLEITYALCVLTFFYKPRVVNAFKGVYENPVSAFPMYYQQPPQSPYQGPQGY